MIARTRTLLHRRGTRELVKFCFVGATSTAIDKGILWLLLSMAPRMPWWISAGISSCLAITNGFVWNRHWTFRAGGHGRMQEQYSRFVATNLIGLVLNIALTKLFLVLFTGQLRHISGNPKTIKVLIASLAAVPCVTVWNFAASKYWTFRPIATGQEAIAAAKR